MKSWKIGGALGFVLGLTLGNFSLFSYVWEGSSSPIWIKILTFSPVMDFFDSLFLSIGLTDQNILMWIFFFGIFYGIYFGIGAMIGAMIGKIFSPKSPNSETDLSSQSAKP